MFRARDQARESTVYKSVKQSNFTIHCLQFTISLCAYLPGVGKVEGASQPSDLPAFLTVVGHVAAGRDLKVGVLVPAEVG